MQAIGAALVRLRHDQPSPEAERALASTALICAAAAFRVEGLLSQALLDAL